MRGNIIKYTFLILSVLFLWIDNAGAQTKCDESCNYEFIEKNDSIVELRVSINGMNATADYYSKTNKDENIPIPKFQGRYKDCLLFMLGYGQHFRLLITFQANNGKIIKEDYEHSMCLNSNGKEAYLFFYNEQPVKMEYDYRTSTVKFKKLRNSRKYNSLRGKVIESCKNSFSSY